MPQLTQVCGDFLTFASNANQVSPWPDRGPHHAREPQLPCSALFSLHGCLHASTVPRREHVRLNEGRSPGRRAVTRGHPSWWARLGRLRGLCFHHTSLQLAHVFEVSLTELIRLPLVELKPISSIKFLFLCSFLHSKSEQGMEQSSVPTLLHSLPCTMPRTHWWLVGLLSSGALPWGGGCRQASNREWKSKPWVWQEENRFRVWGPFGCGPSWRLPWTSTPSYQSHVFPSDPEGRQTNFLLRSPRVP